MKKKSKNNNKPKSRTKNSLINSTMGIVSNFTITLLNFLVRTIFIYYLSKEYLGINGLFSNILYILNFAELGVGSAIVYKLYKPVADDNRERIKELVYLYKRVYYLIGSVVLIIGLILIPFLPLLIKDAPNIKESLVIIYIFYLLETVGTYFFGYNRDILLVYQKNYVCSLIDLICSIVKSIIQTFILIFTRDYILYLVVYVLSTIISNVIISLYTKRKYEYLKNIKNVKVDKKEVKELWANVKSIFVYKLGSTVLSGTDNIILSMIVGITAVGLYSNYSLVVTAVSGILWIILKGLTGSIGNLNTIKDAKKQEKVYYQVLYVACMLHGFGSCCMAVLLNPFINVWIGKEYLVDMFTVICITVVCYLRGIAFPSNTYRDTLGLFKDGRLAPLICSIVNIVLSIILGKIMGMKGVFLATIISIVSTTFWYMPRIIEKKIFGKNVYYFLYKFSIFTLPFVVSYFIIQFIFSYMNANTIGMFIAKTAIATVISILVPLVMLIKNKEQQALIERIKLLIKGRL